MTEAGRLCAFITKVKRGSLADTVGHLRPGKLRHHLHLLLPHLQLAHLLTALLLPGDQVLEWNGRVLQGATFNQVYNIILESKAEPQVELLVSRNLRWVRYRSSEGELITFRPEELLPHQACADFFCVFLRDGHRVVGSTHGQINSSECSS